MDESPASDPQPSSSDIYAQFAAPKEKAGTPEDLNFGGSPTRVVYQYQYSESYVMDLAEHVWAAAHVEPLSYKLRKLLIFSLIAIGYIALALPMMPPFAVFASAGFGLVVAMMTPSRPQLDKERLSQEFRSLPFRDHDTCVTINEDGLSSIDGIADIKVLWPAISKCQEFFDGLLLIKGPQQFFWLPDSALSSGTRDDAEQLVRKHIVDFQRID